MENQPVPPQQLNIEIAEKEAEGIYSNLAFISHSPSEFVIDFARMLPGVPKAKVYSRIVTTPQHAKMLLGALEDNIKKFEAQFGAIKTYGPDEKGIGFKIGDKTNGK
ncbi:MAG TPA: DUF3467 domain-containing protein [Candidatus Edwardsbacteria bacterium]|nr:DUF3467 domain-containing protein [Candidatus Edwardsbacteria bacterium]